MSKKVMRNRGLSKFVTGHINEWKLTRHFSPVNVQHYTHANFPNADKHAVRFALDYAAQKGGLTKISRGVYTKLNGAPPQQELIFEQGTNLDQVLNAMVVMEGFIREHRDIIGLIKQIKGVPK